MKLLSTILTRFTKKTPEKKSVYLSLVLTPSTVLSAVWNLGQDGHVEIIKTAVDSVVADTWDERLISSDHVISSCEDKVGPSEIKNVILGLSEEYLTSEGDVAHDVRGPLKKILSSLGLTALGYVGLDSALSFYFKKTEGIPPSCIFIHCGISTIDVTLYSVGQKIGREHVKISGKTVLDIENAIKKIAQSEILPPRIMLYGMNEQDLEEFRRSLMKHPWTAKLQFLHFPKIESIPGRVLAKSVVMAGASELVHTVSDKDESSKTQQMSEEEQKSKIHSTKKQPITGQFEVVEEDANLTDQKDTTQETSYEDEDVQNGEDVNKVTSNREVETVISQYAPKKEEVENVEIVDPTELGFGPADDEGETSEENISEDETLKENKRISPLMKLRSAIIGALHFLPAATTKKKKNILLAIISGGILIAGIAGYNAWQWFVPKATVTLFIAPKIIEKSATVTVSTKSSAIDYEKAVIPGKKIEKTVSGEKTATVSGTKKVGDPARGTVTLYNKSLSAKTLEKGSIFTFGSLSFTLDSEVTIASASESIGSITFGKATGALTASAIGPESNISANSEFISKEYGGNVVIARNEQAFAGGTSRSVSVVTSADMNKVVTSLTSELSSKAKEEIASESSGGLTLIDSTIEISKDISKTFDKELDQEAKDITGKVTLTVTGIAYNPEDIKTLLKSKVNADVPKGYIVNETRDALTIGDSKIEKDKSITIPSSIQSSALPIVDEKEIAKKIAGTSTDALKMILRDIPGITNVSVFFGKNSSSGKLPKNPANITIKIAVSK